MGVGRDFIYPGGGVLEAVYDRSGGHTLGAGAQISVTVTVTAAHRAATLNTSKLNTNLSKRISIKINVDSHGIV
jgi:hypothetical protein